VGENTILNTRSLVEHDAVIGSHCHISTGAIVNGAATVDDRCFVGSHATVVQMAHLPADSFLKANALLK
jgi:carbonic anhydrase/acetyltransferase-like protein (isoleucine patch superfamily)